jgi:cation:H+ antiporter
MEYVKVLAGFVLLLLGGNYLVKGGVSLAGHLKISSLVVGITFVSLGTSAPELIVSLQAALNGHPDISIGNVVGSNISNIALVLAITAIIIPIKVSRDSVIINWPVMMLASLLFYFFILNFSLDRWEGIIFVLGLATFLYLSIRNSRLQHLNSVVETAKPSQSVFIALLIVVLSCAGLAIGSNWLVNGAATVARNFGVSERVISITLIAFGTSVPELATSVIAAVKKELDISVGNIIGSNIFNLFGVLGITASFTSIPVNSGTVRFDVPWMLGISLLLFLFILPLRGGRLTRLKGIIMLLSYATYIALVIITG